jgi:hypothetical protein
MLKGSIRNIFNEETLPSEMMCEHAGHLRLELIQEGQPHLYTRNKMGGKKKKEFENVKYT